MYCLLDDYRSTALYRRPIADRVTIIRYLHIILGGVMSEAC
jgi:hypothetical protein